MSYAIIQLAGKQYKVSQGDKLTVNKLDVAEGETLTIADVLLVADNDKIQVGSPLVEKANVILKILSHQKGDKLRVATYKAKSRYRRVIGHRQRESIVEVVKISA
jgi:large subunit ribosomal protein L21